MSEPPRPPRWAEGLLRRLVPFAQRDEILGDLAETWARKRSRGAGRAHLWYCMQALAVPAWIALGALRAVRWSGGDVARSLRTLRRTPRFALAALVSLSLGIGATTTIAGAMDAILFETLPVEEPEQLALVYHTWPDRWEGRQYGSSQATDPRDGTLLASNVSYPAFVELDRAVGESFQLAGYAFVREMAVVDGDRPALAAGGMVVSGDFFATLRVGMEVGRPLGFADESPGAPLVVVLSHRFWQSSFGADPEIVGRRIELNGTSVEVVGVAQRDFVGLSPGGFFGPSDVIATLNAGEALFPIGMAGGQDLQTAADLQWIRLLARVTDPRETPGFEAALSSTLGAAFASGAVIAEDVAGDVQVRFLEGRRGLDSLRSGAEGPLRLLGAIVVLVLLIACGNLATLLLARGATRRSELAVRRAVGAGRWDLARPLLAESMVLALGGAVGGVLIAGWAGPLVTSVITGGAGSSVAFEVDARLVGAAAAAALIAAFASSLFPALRAIRVDPRHDVRPRSRAGAGFPALGRGLIVAQIAVSVPLVVGAGLFLRTLGNLSAVDEGFDPEGVLLFRLDPSFTTQDADEGNQLFRRVLDELRQTEGMGEVSAIENVLLSGWQSDTDVEIAGESHHMQMNAVGPGIWSTLRIPLLAGRDFQESDRADAPGVVIVNETASRRFFGGSAVGARMRLDGRDLEVVGVVGDTRYTSLRAEPAPTFYDPWIQRAGGLFTLHVVVRPTMPLAAAEAAVRTAVARVDPGLPVVGLRSQTADVSQGSAKERLFAQLLSAFGLFALVLAGIGLHGITAFAVARRTAEIGVRLALGAAPAGIVRMVLRQIATLAGAGLVLGLAGAWALGPVVRSMLFGVAPSDPWTLAAAAGVMMLSALVAAWVPARRAARLDPRSALSPGGGG